MRDVSKRIRELRIGRGMSQDALAGKLFVTRQAVSNWETKKTRPDIETLEKISAVFEIELTELLYGAEKKAVNKKYVRMAAFFGAVIVISLLVAVFIWPNKADVFKMDGGVNKYYFMAAFLRPCLYGCIFPFVLSFMSIWTDICIKKAPVRKALLILGVVMLAVYLYGAIGISLNVFTGESGTVTLPRWLASSTFCVYMYFSKQAATSVVYGALLFLGINKKAAI